MKSKKYKKRRKTAVLNIAHIRHSESTNVMYKTYVTCEITLHVAYIVIQNRCIFSPQSKFDLTNWISKPSREYCTSK